MLYGRRFFAIKYCSTHFAEIFEIWAWDHAFYWKWDFGQIEVSRNDFSPNLLDHFPPDSSQFLNFGHIFALDSAVIKSIFNAKVLRQVNSTKKFENFSKFQT